MEAVEEMKSTGTDEKGRTIHDVGVFDKQSAVQKKSRVRRIAFLVRWPS